MSTTEDFKKAPIGAIATHEDGARALKVDGPERRWILQNGLYLNDKEIEQWGYTLDPALTAPTSAREALDLAWDLAHEVKEGQVISVGTEYFYKNAHKVRAEEFPFKIIASTARNHRTLDPLPDPEPDWLDAPAVMAKPEDDTWVAVWQPCDAPWCSGATRNESRWVSPRGGAGCRSWRELTDVTPLYPKGQDA